MPTICAFYGIIIQMFWNDHAPPHFHALYAEHEAIIDIETLKVIRGEMPREHFLSYWNGLFYIEKNYWRTGIYAKKSGTQRK